ncbi:MAG TPA: NADH-quinone oxidoreductase subunit NuoG [Gammaproteobacteria bacterium]|nr:NADH-quinone oxidoreductase subunit NuoG [Gammaproteobacteria bacterium]
MSDQDQVTIEVDGVELKARKGQMLMQVTDDAGIYIPRFCYHKKLSVVANCRMCLVEVENAPKPMPACATPVNDGMKVHTQSDKTIDAQKGTMEFLLINHPLDCPICDQGGECELQDLAMGFGSDVSRFTEGKRSVEDPDLGPLISTGMTRCIHCTRCVRFGEEIAGVKELGATGRGEHMKIGTYVERTVDHELSGNVIDLCPVGALTSRPFRFRARAWEMDARPSVAPHDALGSNIYFHTRRGRIMRVVPADNEAVNETWISDRDRFSYQGIYSDERIDTPLVREDGALRQSDWQTALERAAGALKGTLDRHGAAQLGMLAAPNATLEELHLLRRIADGLGVSNLDHRLGQSDFSDPERDPVFPWLGQSVGELEQNDGILVVGANLRKEIPLIGHRVRKAALGGARVGVINPCDWDLRFPLESNLVVRDLAGALAGVAAAVAAQSGKSAPAAIEPLLEGVEPDAAQERAAALLVESGRATVLLGQIAAADAGYGSLRALAAFISEAAGARLGYLPLGGNAAGAWLSGFVPHRGPGGVAAAMPGLHAGDMIEQGLKGYLLFNVEPELDCARPARALEAMKQAETVVAVASFHSEGLAQYADVVLPAATFGETSGTFINLAGDWQSFNGAGVPVGDSRPAWKILRVLGNELALDGFDFESPQDVREAARQAIGEVRPDNAYVWPEQPFRRAEVPALKRVGELPIYATDPLVRRAEALQRTKDGLDARKAWMNPADADRMGLVEADRVSLHQGEGSAVLPLALDPGVAAGCVVVAAGIPETRDLDGRSGAIEVRAVEAAA